MMGSEETSFRRMVNIVQSRCQIALSCIKVNGTLTDDFMAQC